MACRCDTLMPEVKEMKKTISSFLILCLLLPGVALADVQSQINAPEHLETTIKSKQERQKSSLMQL